MTQYKLTKDQILSLDSISRCDGVSAFQRLPSKSKAIFTKKTKGLDTPKEDLVDKE